jgi:hypothetical protein
MALGTLHGVIMISVLHGHIDQRCRGGLYDVIDAGVLRYL